MPIPALIAAAGRFIAGVATRGGASAAAGKATSSAASRGGMSAAGKAASAAVNMPGTGRLQGPRNAGPPQVNHGHSTESRLDKLWRYDSAWNLVDRISGTIAGNLPAFQHSIQVAVIGGPAADLRRCWFLACSAAFGRYRNRSFGTGSASIDATWDVTSKSVQISIGYVFSGVVSNTGLPSVSGSAIGGVPNWMLPAVLLPGGAALLGAFGIGRAAVAAPKKVDNLNEDVSGGLRLIQQGPDQVTVGGGWKAFGIGTRNEVATGDYTPAIPRLIFENYGGDNAIVRFVQDGGINLYGELPYLSNDGSVGVGTGSIGTLPTVNLPYGKVGPVESVAPDGFKQAARIVNYTFGYTFPKLPDDGRLITTGEKRHPNVQPPKPWVDGKSRMSIVELIHDSLNRPCFAPDAVAKSPAPIGSPGHNLYPAGQAIDKLFNVPSAAFATGTLSNPTKPAVYVPWLGET